MRIEIYLGFGAWDLGFPAGRCVHKEGRFAIAP